MKNLIRLSVIGLVVGLAAQAQALIVPQTNVVQSISIRLTIYSQGDPTTNGSTITWPVVKSTKSTKDVIQLLGKALTNTFSSNAKLILLTPVGYDNSTVYVQDGSNNVDVSDFFAYEQVGSVDVQKYQTNTVSHVEKSTDYSIASFSMKDTGPYTLAAHFTATGLSTVTAASLTKSGVILGKARQIALDLAGSGDFTDNLGEHDMLVQVTLTITGSSLVVMP